MGSGGIRIRFRNRNKMTRIRNTAPKRLKYLPLLPNGNDLYVGIRTGKKHWIPGRLFRIRPLKKNSRTDRIRIHSTANKDCFFTAGEEGGAHP
jgi:hypothetical protein